MWLPICGYQYVAAHTALDAMDERQEEADAYDVTWAKWQNTWDYAGHHLKWMAETKIAGGTGTHGVPLECAGG